MSRANVSSWEIEIRSVDSSSGRGSMPRARSRSSRPTLPGRTCRRSASVIAAMSPIVSIPSADEPLLRARPHAREDPDRERREERRLAARADDRQPAGLAPVRGDLGHDLGGRHAERAREPGARPHDRLHRLGQRAGVVEGGRDLAEVEVALVDPRLLDGRHDLPDERPDLARVVAVERVARGHEHRVGAASERLRRPTSRSGSRSSGRRSCRSRPRRGRVDRLRRSAAPAGATGPRAPRRRRRTRRDRGGRRS